MEASDKNPAGPSPLAEHLVDELLVLRVQEGHRDAFRQLAERWQERLWRHAFRLTRREDAAWDVVQESWVSVTRGIRALRDPGSFRRWAFTIVTRAATDRLRKLGNEPRGDEPFTEPSVDSSEEDDREQAISRLRAALAHLKGDERALVSLRYLEDFEIWELARIFEIPEGTVKSRLHHTRNRLKEILERMER